MIPFAQPGFSRAWAADDRSAAAPLNKSAYEGSPVESVEQHFLVSISRAGGNAPAIRLVFLKPVTDGGTPSMGEVLWWVAGDAWVLERANQELYAWAATYGYPAEVEATAWLFEQARRESGGLARLLGTENMRALMELYEAEVGPSRAG